MPLAISNSIDVVSGTLGGGGGFIADGRILIAARALFFAMALEITTVCCKETAEAAATTIGVTG